MEIVLNTSPYEVAGHALVSALEKHAGKPVLILVSGGSAFKILEYVGEQFLSSLCTLGVLDERYSSDVGVNNFLQLEKTAFFKTAVKKDVSIIDTSVHENEDMLHFRTRWEGELHAWVENNPTGIVLVTMGMGSDGHTAGIFPNAKGVSFGSSEWVVAYHVPPIQNLHTERVTVTHTFLRDIVTEAFVLIQGDSKTEALRKVEEGAGSLTETPARIFREIPSVKVFTDIGA